MALGDVLGGGDALKGGPLGDGVKGHGYVVVGVDTDKVRHG